MTDQEIERLCIALHDWYEDAAIREGWETQMSTRVLWPDVPDANKRTMRSALRGFLMEPEVLRILRDYLRRVDAADELSRYSQEIERHALTPEQAVKLVQTGEWPT